MTTTRTTTTRTTTITGSASPSTSPPAFPRFTVRGFVTATNAVSEKHITKVPTMGDSITEGTIVEWMVQVGQRVEEEDVIALIETDKVTVDIKAGKAGVMTQQFGAVDDEVEVGADLYEIDSEAEPTVEADAAAEAAQPAAAAPVSAPSSGSTPVELAATDDPSTKPSSRVPAIKFLGKEGWQRVLTPEPEVSIPPSYGRLEFSEEEIEALISGGANLAPDVEEFSDGAVFSA